MVASAAERGPPSSESACMCVQKLKKDPYVTTLGGFSKVTNYIFDAFRGTEEQHQRPPEEVADLLGEVIPGLEINQLEEPGFEVITRVRAGLSFPPFTDDDGDDEGGVADRPGRETSGVEETAGIGGGLESPSGLRGEGEGRPAPEAGHL